MNAIVPPANLSAYTTALCGPMEDKLFFAARLPDDVSVFVDFGCADGTLLWRTMQERFGRPGYADNLFFGFDHDVEMLRAANKRVSHDAAFFLTADFEALERRLLATRTEGRKSVLILSSVVHEVLSQGEHRDQTFERFWDETVRRLGCDYVVFRDMAVATGLENAVSPVLWREKLDDPRTHPAALVLYGDMFGTRIPSRKEFIHFLLKVIHPVEDWAKELGENYLPFSATEYLNRMTVGSGYRLAHYETASLPYLIGRWQREVGVYVPDDTHVKIILKKGS